MDKVIAVEGLTKNFANLCAVDSISINVNKSDIFGFLGPNGSGKTTTIRMLCGLLTPDAGTGSCLGYDIINESHLIKNHVGYMPQRFSLYEDLSVIENLRFVACLYGVDNCAAKVKQVMTDFALTTRQNQVASSLSGGWKQKLTLAACLVHNPELLLLDEPTAGIDPRSRRDFWDIIYDLSKDGLTTLVTTHYMDEAQRCNKLAYISYSKLLIEGTEEYILNEIGLKTYLVTGDVLPISTILRKQQNIDVVAFGRSLHINSTSEKELDLAIKPFLQNKSVKFKKIDTTIEDAFIHMVGESNA